MEKTHQFLLPDPDCGTPLKTTKYANKEEIGNANKAQEAAPLRL